jgi:hypothetical protein
MLARLFRDKHPIISQKFVNYGRKKFQNIGSAHDFSHVHGYPLEHDSPVTGFLSLHLGANNTEHGLYCQLRPTKLHSFAHFTFAGCNLNFEVCFHISHEKSYGNAGQLLENISQPLDFSL